MFGESSEVRAEGGRQEQEPDKGFQRLRLSSSRRPIRAPAAPSDLLNEPRLMSWTATDVGVDHDSTRK